MGANAHVGIGSGNLGIPKTTRRQFLIGAGTAGALLLNANGANAAGVNRVEAAPGAATAASPTALKRRHRKAKSSLDVFTGGFPRAFVYRQAGTLAATMDYPTWLQQMSQLNGILGKVLPEEQPISGNVVDYFNQFKQQFPSKIVLAHLNGWERVPQWETTNWSAGFWLHRAGTTLNQPCSATDTVLHVGNTVPFSVATSYYGNRGDDICLAAMGPGGVPDFTHAEQVVLMAIDSVAGTLTVSRGQYGTSPLAFAGGAFVAPHLTRGPFIGNGPMLWMYNYSTAAPLDPNGKSVIDAVVDGLAPGEGLAAKFAPGGLLAAFDGVALDANSFWPPPNLNADCNNDGSADGGIIGGVDVFGIGVDAFVTRLRTALGPNRVIIVDGETTSHGGNLGWQRPNAAQSNGIELEGFPNLFDSTALQWSEAMATLTYWNQYFTHKPALCYPLYKTDLFPPNTVVTPNGPLRLAVAASLLAGTQFTYYQDPDGTNATGVQSLTIWDELVAGTLGNPNWLGQPSAPAQHIALKSDVLKGAGLTMSTALVASVAGTSIQKSVTGQGAAGAILTVAGTASQDPLTFTLSGVPLTTGSDLVIRMQVSSQAEPAYVSTLDRRLFVGAARGGTGKQNVQSTPSGSNWFDVYLYFRGLAGSAQSVTLTFQVEGPQAVSIRNLTAYNAPDVVYRRFQNGAVFANPSLSPYSFPVSTLAPGASFSRLQGTANQDPATNNGARIQSPLTIPAVDALLVIGM